MRRNIALHVVNGAIVDMKNHNGKFDYTHLSLMWDLGEIYVRVWDDKLTWNMQTKTYIPGWLWGQVIKGAAWARNMDQLPKVVQLYASLLD